MIIREVVSCTITSTAATHVYSGHYDGYLHGISYVRSATPISSGANVKVQTETGAITALTSAIAASTLDWTYFPRVPTHNTTGGVLVVNQSSIANTTAHDLIPMWHDRVKISVFGASSSGLTGTFHVYVDGMRTGTTST